MDNENYKRKKPMGFMEKWPPKENIRERNLTPTQPKQQNVILGTWNGGILVELIEVACL